MGEVSAPQFAHRCPFVGEFIHEGSALIVHCRCYDSEAFYAFQDAMALQLDLLRKPAEQ